MGKVIVLDDTSREPLSIIGKSAGICWESDITSDFKNIKGYRKILPCNNWRNKETVQ